MTPQEMTHRRICIAIRRRKRREKRERIARSPTERVIESNLIADSEHTEGCRARKTQGIVSPSPLIQRAWAMPNRQTFAIPPIRELLGAEMMGARWVDPFAGELSPAYLRNDLNPAMPTQYHLDALEFLKRLPSNSFDGGLYDPPYSPTQVKRCYNGFGIRCFDATKRFWSETKNELARVIKPGGKAICCGWSSNGLGRSRGFTMTRVLIVAHGGTRNDTIATVDVKE
jgi:hypothetical protein